MTYTQAKLLIQHWRAQLAMDCDNTGDAIRHIVRLNQRAKEADALRAALTTANARAEAAEARVQELETGIAEIYPATEQAVRNQMEALELQRANTEAWLAELAQWKQRAEAAEARMVAVPVAEIKQLYIATITPSDPERYKNYRRVGKWLFPDEVQP